MTPCRNLIVHEGSIMLMLRGAIRVIQLSD